jgi:zinc protease
MKKVHLLLLLVAASAVSAAAQTPASAPVVPAPDSKSPAVALPSADEILSRNLQAVGGAAAWQKLNSRTSNGTIDIPALSAQGTVQLDQKAPNRLRSVASITGFGDVHQAFDGAAGWADDPQNGSRDVSGAELLAIKRRANFYLPIRMKESFTHVTVKGIEKVNGHEAYVLEAVPAEGASETLFFDVQSALLVERVTDVPTPQGEYPQDQFFEDYRDVDGIKLPFTLRQKSPTEWVIYITEVHHNVAIDDAKFLKPAAPK